MRGRLFFAGLSILLGTSFIVAQPPKAGNTSPRPLPELSASTMPDKANDQATAASEKKTLPALIKVKVPENATVWFENQKMSQSGSTRVFQSPGLETKKTYYYKVKVSWPTGVGTMTKDFVSEQEVAVRGGETTSVDFMPLASHTKQQKPLSTSEMIRQAAHNTPAPANKNKKSKDDDN